MIRTEVIKKLMLEASRKLNEVATQESATAFEILSAYASLAAYALESGFDAGVPYRVLERAAWEILVNLNEKKGPGDAPKNPIDIH